MSGGARPGAGRKREKPLTLTEIGQKLAPYYRAGQNSEFRVRGRFLQVITTTVSVISYTKQEAQAHLNSLEWQKQRDTNKGKR